MICPVCNGKKVVPLSKRKRHLTRPCEVCAGTGEVPDPDKGRVDQAKAEIAAGKFVTIEPATADRRQSDRDEPAPAVVDKLLIAPSGDGPVVVDLAAIIRALGSWTTPRE